MYRIAADHANCRVDVDFIDSYADIEQAGLARDLRAAVLQARGDGDRFDLLVDFTRVPVMSQDATVGARDEIAWCVANGLRRSANVILGTIAKLQLQRLSGDDRFRTFTSRPEALAWLNSPE